jgi:hypothetical protein
MDIESIRKDGYVNRWSLVATGEDGVYEPRCVEDALPITDPGAALAAARNQAIKEALESGEGLTPEAVEERAQEIVGSVALPVPESISDRQFAQALAFSMPDLISRAEAEAWAARGEIPAALLSIVEHLPADYAFAARMKLSSAVEYQRHDPLVDFVGQQMNIPASDIDNLWRLAATL